MKENPPQLCRHCGSPISGDTPAHPGFCCEGCAHVHAVIIESGLEKYYALRDNATAPVEPSALEPRDFSWLRAAQISSEQNTLHGIAALDLALQGISCVGCVWLIEKLFARQSGAVRASINPQEGRVRLEWLPGKTDLVSFAEELQNVGYLLGPAGEKPRGETAGLVLRIGLCGAFAMNGMLHILPSYLGMTADDASAPFFRLLSIFFATLAMLVGGSYFITRAWRSARLGVLHIDLPIALGVSAAYFGSFAGWFLRNPALEYWDFISLFLFLMLTGRWLQERAVERNRLRLLAQNPRPSHVRVYAENAEENPVSRAVETLQPGDIFGVAPGQVLPVRATLLDAPQTLGLEWITGESAPRIFLPGSRVPAGARNLHREEIRCRAEEIWSESLLARLIAACEEKPFRNPHLENIIASYLSAVLFVAVIGLLGWGFGTHRWADALQVFISILVVSCPCTLGLAVPLATELTVGHLRALGVHVRDNSLWERLRRVRVVVFDKTGTLTLENPALQNPEALAALSAAERAALFRLVDSSLHPVSRGLREALLAFPESRRAGKFSSGETVEETAAAGLTLRAADGTVWQLGKPSWISSASEENADVLFSRDGAVRARFFLREAIRPDAVRVVSALEKSRRPVYLLSGDRDAKVSAMLRVLGLAADHGLAGLSPQEKADWINTHAKNRALMIGDGANDALAFSSAICRGTPVVDKGLLEQRADFYLLGRSLDGVLQLFRCAAFRRRVLAAVFAFAVLYNALTVGISLAGKMSPLLAAILMPTSSLVVLALVSLTFRGTGGAKEISSALRE